MVQSDQYADSGTPAPYGRACTNCSRAKCKCIYRNGGNSCERCHRLKKDCQPSVSVRKRIVKKVPETRATQLEEKLDDLVTLLRAQAVAKDLQSTSTTSSHSETPVTCLTGETPVDGSNVSSPYASAKGPQVLNTGNTAALAAASSTCSSWDALLPTDISDNAAEQNLSLFRNTMLKYFPFVYIPPTTTSSDLRRDRPFLWFCIMSITTKSAASHISMGTSIRRAVAEKVIMDGERNMDILLGLLCHFGWCHYYKFCGVGKPYLPMFIHIANAIIYDLGLNVPPPPDPDSVCLKTFWAQTKPTYSTERTMVEKRAVLSMFLMSSSVCTLKNRMDNMQWTTSMNEFLHDIAEHPEWEGDKILAIQLRCHLVLSQVTRAPWATSGLGDENCTIRNHISYFNKAVQLQLQEVKRSIPPELQQNAPILLYLYGTEVDLYEDEIARPPPETETQSLLRVNAYWACIRAIQAWFDVYFSLPLSENVGITFTMFCQLSHCFILLYKLSTLEDPSWDRQMVRQTVDVVDLLEKFAAVMAETPATAGFVGDPEMMAEQNTFAKAGITMRSLAENWRREIEGEKPAGITEGSATGNGLQSPFVGGGIDDYFMMNLANDQWLSDIFGSLNAPT